MGYYTNYNLKITAPELSDYTFYGYLDKKIKDLLDAFSEIGVLNFAFDENFECCNTVKWYEHEDDMREISKRFNPILFILSGEGEESGDSWRKYFLNGKMQTCHAKISYDSYDEKKLI